MSTLNAGEVPSQDVVGKPNDLLFLKFFSGWVWKIGFQKRDLDLKSSINRVKKHIKMCHSWLFSKVMDLMDDYSVVNFEILVSICECENHVLCL